VQFAPSIQAKHISCFTTSPKDDNVSKSNQLQWRLFHLSCSARGGSLLAHRSQAPARDKEAAPIQAPQKTNDSYCRGMSPYITFGTSFLLIAVCAVNSSLCPSLYPTRTSRVASCPRAGPKHHCIVQAESTSCAIPISCVACSI
jgi:hypothetical protein